MPVHADSRTVAIVGRPNVGKSSIFNRLGRRLSIVHSERGVTRDSVIQEVEWDGQLFNLIDTGGLGRLDEIEGGGFAASLEDLVRRQIEFAIADACAIIFVVDAVSGVIPQDEEVAAFLRKSGKPVFVAANKADNSERESNAFDFERFAFPVFPVSALHYSGFDPLMDSVIRHLPEHDSKEDAAEPLRVSIVGRPNVGKSSFINRLLGFERVIVSELPGTTRDSIDTPFRLGEGESARYYVLTDTAGMRSRRKVNAAVENFSLRSAEKSIRNADVVGLVLDARDGPMVQDKKIASLIFEHRKGCVILVNKWDLAMEVGEKRYLEALRRALPFLDFVPVVFISAKTGINTGRAVSTIDSVAASTRAAFSTGPLNRVIKQACDAKSPPLIAGRRTKIYYATQVGTHPPAVALFVNSGATISPQYESYLARVIRREFKLSGCPVVFKMRPKTARQT